MNPTHHDLRSYRKKTCLTQQDISELLGTKDVTQVSRLETGPISPQLEFTLLYHLLFNIPMSNFFPSQKEGMRKRLLLRIPNIINEIRCLPPCPENDEKVACLSKILSDLTKPSL